MSDMSIKRYIFRKGAAKHIPVSGTFELTPRCNLNCEMCYIHMTPSEESKIGTELSTDEWINLGREAVNAGMVYLLLTGGEPFLRKDFCTIYKELARMGLKCYIYHRFYLEPEITEDVKNALENKKLSELPEELKEQMMRILEDSGQ